MLVDNVRGAKENLNEIFIRNLSNSLRIDKNLNLDITWLLD